MRTLPSLLALTGIGRRAGPDPAHIRKISEIADATLDGKRKDYISQMQKVPLLVIDDLGLRKLPSSAAEDMQCVGAGTKTAGSGSHGVENSLARVGRSAPHRASPSSLASATLRRRCDPSQGPVLLSTPRPPDIKLTPAKTLEPRSPTLQPLCQIT